MNARLNPASLLFIGAIILVSWFSACKKDPSFSLAKGDSIVVRVNPTCRIKSEETNQILTNGNQFELSYDADGNLSSVEAYNTGDGTKGSTTVITPTTISTTGNYDWNFVFDQNIFTGQPTGYTLSRPGSGTHDKNHTMLFDASGRIWKVTLSDAKTSQFISYLEVKYDAEDNATQIKYTSADSTSLVYTATGFDDKHNPYDSLKNSNLLVYNWDFFNAPGGDVTYLFSHLSRHNVLGWSLTESGYTINVTLTYSVYTPLGYPDTVLELFVVQNNTEPATTNNYTWVYNYDCK